MFITGAGSTVSSSEGRLWMGIVESHKIETEHAHMNSADDASHWMDYDVCCQINSEVYKQQEVAGFAPERCALLLISRDKVYKKLLRESASIKRQGKWSHACRYNAARSRNNAIKTLSVPLSKSNAYVSSPGPGRTRWPAVLLRWRNSMPILAYIASFATLLAGYLYQHHYRYAVMPAPAAVNSATKLDSPIAVGIDLSIYLSVVSLMRVFALH